MNLAGRTVLLTGATGGLGHAIARRLHAARRAARAHGPAGRGARAAGRGDRRPRAGRRPGRAAAVSGWPASAADVDVLVANAALPGSGALTSFSVEELDRALAVNLRAPMVLARLLGEGMVARGRGHMVFMSSLAGKAATPADARSTRATKFGLRGFAPACARTCAPSGVGGQRVFPGFIRDAGMFHDSGDAAAAASSGRVAAGRRRRASCGRSSATAARSTSRRSRCAPARRRRSGPGPRGHAAAPARRAADRRGPRQGPDNQALEMEVWMSRGRAGARPWWRRVGCWWPGFPGRRESAQLFSGDARLIFEGWVPHGPVFVAVRGLERHRHRRWLVVAHSACADCSSRRAWPSASRARPGSTGADGVVRMG